MAITLLLAVPAFAFPIRMALAPDNNQAVLNSVLNSATRELIINIYQFESPEIAAVIISKIKSGVTVRLLVEGEPLGSISPNGKKLLSAIAGAIRASGNPDSRLAMMTRSKNNTRRFRFNHAKYVISDRRYVLISSENFTATGHPVAGQIGNRGWDVVMDNSSLAEDLMQVFRSDADARNGDVLLVRSNARVLPPATTKGPRRAQAIPDAYGNAASVRLVASPRSLDEIVSLIRSARVRIDVEKMSLPASWRSPVRRENPIVTELIRAAQRGVDVRVLLNDDTVFGGGEPDDSKGNAATVALLRQVAKAERLPISARTVNVRRADISYIHNKGILVDGEQAFVSSINGTQNSVENNREIAVVLRSPDAAKYYGYAFEFDWRASAPTSTYGTRPANGLVHDFSSFFTLSAMWNSRENQNSPY